MFSIRTVSNLLRSSKSILKCNRNLGASAALEIVDDSNWYNDSLTSNSYHTYQHHYNDDFDNGNAEPNIELFDVSMRDGLQTYNNILPTNKKILMINQLIEERNPEVLEIGSIVSQKVLPQFHDSIPLYDWATYEYPDKDFYLLIPNEKGVEIALENNIANLSFITSVSDSFQQKNIKKSLTETKQQLDKMYSIANQSEVIRNIKLYVSCINECPIEGIINTNLIVNEIEEYYNKYPMVTNICLSDTCGTLTYLNFRNIIDKLSGIVPLKNLSLHLHYSNKDQIENILLYAYDRGLTKFDVSNIENSGGCSVTIDSGKTNANLSYQDIDNISF